VWQDILKVDREAEAFKNLQMVHENILSMIQKIEEKHNEQWEIMNDPNNFKWKHYGKLVRDLDEMDKLFMHITESRSYGS
jgi:soluble cytochrome b562